MNGNRTVTRNLAINRHVIGCQWIKVHIHEHNAPVRHIVASNAQVIPDNTGGHLMQHGQVDVVIVGTDRTTADGDVCNKIGTYLKALAAHDNGVPFYVGLPFTTIDWTLEDGIRQIPIEERDARELSHMTGRTADGRLETVDILPRGSTALNYGFDVTPARLVTGLITERGVADASREGLLKLYPERQAQ